MRTVERCDRQKQIPMVTFKILIIFTAFISIFSLQATLCKNINESENVEPIVVSLGCHCAPAMCMTEHGLRKVAFPFDWMFTNNFEGFCRVLSSDFTDFLSEDFLDVHPYLPFVVVNKHYGIEFRHDFPRAGPSLMSSILDSDWRDHILSIKEKYNRRIARFNQLACHKGKVFFIRMAYNSPWPYEWPKVITQSESIILRDILKAKFPQTDFDLIVVNYVDEVDPDEYKSWQIDGIRNYNINDYQSGYRNIFKELGLIEN